MSGEHADDGEHAEDRTPTEDETTPGDAAIVALARAREAARAKGLRPGQRPRWRGGANGGSASGTERLVDGTRRPVPGTGPGFPPGSRPDPRPVGETLGRLMAQRGWTEPVGVGGVIGRWREVVGPDIADHATPETFTDGRLVVRTTSTAWATQLQLLLPQLERRLAEEVGEGVVAEVVVIGPGAPSWVRGQRVVRGRGPRDTYG
ncbi:DUF721 domain-containing protein [Miniimonas arenae]|uniref:DUF721 domain-containing protein n=1 Tax=Miniimonas arenae TaxID=676201 RepID=UPI0028ACD580|nr:DciA family protein [Miniimonas arenae]